MKLRLSFLESVEQNASLYFEKAKKCRKKQKGAKEAVQKLKLRLDKAQEKLATEQELQATIVTTRKKEWYEKYRWFFTSEGFLVIGGRDATSNEIIVKKHAENEDVVFHTDMSGSPFFVIKAEGKKIGKASIQEAADATASFSRAWTKGLSSLATFWVTPDQVTKTANPGEFLPKGAFMIRGKTNYVDVKMEVAVGMKDGRIISGPLSAVKAQTKETIIIHQGEKKKSDIAKLIARKFKADLDEVMHMMPPGNGQVIP